MALNIEESHQKQYLKTSIKFGSEELIGDFRESDVTTVIVFHWSEVGDGYVSDEKVETAFLDYSLTVWMKLKEDKTTCRSRAQGDSFVFDEMRWFAYS